MACFYPPKLSDTGRRQRRFFKSKTEAAGEIKRIKVRLENHGTAAKLLSPSDEQQAVSAFKLLRDFGSDIQLIEIVGEYLDRLREKNLSKTLSDAWDLYLARTDKKISPVHQKNLKATKKGCPPFTRKWCRTSQPRKSIHALREHPRLIATQCCEKSGLF